MAGRNFDWTALPDGELADALGRLDAEARGIDAERLLAKAEVKRRGGEVRGARFRAYLVEGHSTSWKSDKLEAELGDRARYFRQRSPYSSVRTALLPGVI